MSESIMLKANLADISVSNKNEESFFIRNCRKEDAEELGELYFQSYDLGHACETLEESITDIQNSFKGEYGSFWFESSKIVEKNGKVIGAVMVVHKNSWDEAVTCPYIIELFVDRKFRKNGIAKTLLLNSINEVREAGQKEMALTVVAENTPARNLYKTLGFSEEPIQNK